MESKESQNRMYNNCQAYGEELEDVFSESEILYLIEYKNNRSNDNYKQPKNYAEIVNIIQKLVDEYKETEAVNNNNLKDICLDLWFYCMGWTQLQYKNKTINLLQLIDTNCNELFNYMSSIHNINVLMMLLKICLTEHRKSIDSVLEESQGVITFDQIAKQTDNANIISFWNTFSILNICMNSILCIAWSQRNSPNITNNPLFIDTFHIDKEPLFVHLFNYISQDNYCERMPIKKFIIYIRWHIFFTNNTANQLNQIRNTFKTNKLKKKCAVTDFFEIADKIDSNYTPLLVLPPSINITTNNGKEASGFNRLSNAPSILKKSINELFGNDEDEKYDKNAQIKYERPSGLDYKYPIYGINIRRFQCEAATPRIELFGKDIVPTHMTNLLQHCFEHLADGSGKKLKYNMYACDIYKYLTIKSQIPDWILMQQSNKNMQFNKKDSSPKWLQNIRMSLGIKMLVKLMCSTMPSSYCQTANKINMRATHVPDIRYEIIASVCNEQHDLNYFMDLKRHQNILIFNILMLLLGLLKLFRTHEILQFEYLKHLIQKNNGIIVLCKLFAHPWTRRPTEKKVFITKAETYIDIQHRQQLFDMIYDGNGESEGAGKVSSKIVTIKINALRIMQKCVKYSFGHCNLLCNVLSYHQWLAKYLDNTNDIAIERYYILKLFKSMMPFINNNKKEYEDIIELITSNIRIGVNDQWLSAEIKQEFDAVITKYKEKQEKAQNLQIDSYYQWLALKRPTERDYAETRFNPFAIQSNYGIPNLAQIAPQKWTQLVDNECTSYHEWLIQQIECDNQEFLKQKKYIGLTRKEMERQKMIERSDKVDKGLASIVIPADFDFTQYLKAYFSGNADKMLDKI